MNDGDAGPVDWSQFYQDMAVSGQSPAATSTEPTMPSGSRSTKPARKRSRTSRRAPTTLLNTDTTNFRAMVQQFTGGPSVAAPYMAAGPTTLNFGIGFHDPASQSPAAILPSYGVQQYQYQYRQPPPAPPQQQEMIGFGIGENIEEFFLDGIGGQPSENNRAGGYFL